jgi:hypothetical protein
VLGKQGCRARLEYKTCAVLYSLRLPDKIILGWYYIQPLGLSVPARYLKDVQIKQIDGLRDCAHGARGSQS